MSTLRLSPAGVQLEVPAGARLQDILFAHGVEFACGGRGRCKSCRVRLRRGQLPVSAEEATQLTAAQLAAGLRLLATNFAAPPADTPQLHLAGAFGNYISRAGARRIGLLCLPPDRIVPAGNTALLGAKMALFGDVAKWDALARNVDHMTLHDHADFQDIYAEEMRFPEAGQSCQEQPRQTLHQARISNQTRAQAS